MCDGWGGKAVWFDLFRDGNESVAVFVKALERQPLDAPGAGVGGRWRGAAAREEEERNQAKQEQHLDSAMGYYLKCYPESQLMTAYAGQNVSFSCDKPFVITRYSTVTSD